MYGHSNHVHQGGHTIHKPMKWMFMQSKTDSRLLSGPSQNNVNWTKASLIISFGLWIFITILVGREVEIKNRNKTFVYTTFYFAGIANFLLLFSREEGIKPSPAAAIVW
jgi:hypothetical protein